MRDIAGPAGFARRSWCCIAFATAAVLLAGCGSLPADLLPDIPALRTTGVADPGLPRWQPAAPDGRSALLARIVVDPAVLADAGAAVPQALLGSMRLWNIEDGSEVPVLKAGGMPLQESPSKADVVAGWTNLAVAPGRHFLRLEAAGAVPLDVTFTVPATPSTLYIGSFLLACEGGTPASAAGRACRLLPVLDQSAEAQALLPDARRAAFPFAAALARPFPPRLAGLGLPPPMAPVLRLDPAGWSAAIDWEQVLRDTPATGNGGGCQPAGAGMGAGLPMLVGVALVIAGPVWVVRSVRDRVQAAALRRRAEAMRAAWSPCEAGIAGALLPAPIGEHLGRSPAFTPPAPARPGRQRSVPPNPWQATVTRVVLRHCGTTPDGFGVEVATRWTAQPPGAPAPVFDVTYSRAVQGATADARLRHATRPPWEVPAGPDAPCRPLAAYCAPGGETLLLDDILQAITGARDAIAAAR